MSRVRKACGRLARSPLLRDESGAVVLLVALAVVPVLLAAGLAVDGGRYLLARSRLAQAADAAALAAGARLDTAEARSVAERILRANFPEGFLGLELEDVRVAYDEDSGRVTLETSARMPTTFMRVAHVDSVPVTTRTVVVRATQPMDVALVLDVTGSMLFTRGKFDGMKRAARDLVEILFGGEERSTLLRVAVVPFNARVNVGDRGRGWLSSPPPRDWNGCTESRSYTSFDAASGTSLALGDAPPRSGALFSPSPSTYSVRTWRGTETYRFPCPPELLPLTARRSVVLDVIDDLEAGGSTRIDMGTRWGWRVLSPRWEGLWGEDERTPTATEPVRAVVIMTDGQNETSGYYDEVDAARADANLLAICTAMKAQGYLVYSVTYAYDSRWTDSVVRGCATSADHYFRAPTAADLQAAFRQIGSELSALRIAE